MSYSFEYIDIILLAMIAGFIFLRLRGILGKKTGYEEDLSASFPHEAPEAKSSVNLRQDSFDENAKKEFLKGAKIAYETIIVNFSKGNLKEIKSLLDKSIYEQFDDAVRDKASKNIKSETTFIGIDSAEIKEYNQNDKIIEVTVDFVSQIISCTKDKDENLISGDPKKIKSVHDIWKFYKDSTSNNPNWFLVDTQA